MPLLRNLRAAVYDRAIVGMTAGWYRAVFDRLPPQCRMLDVGIGTGSALLANARLVYLKDLHITGIDIDAAYIERCRLAIAKAELSEQVEVRLESVYDHRGGPYEAVYFSASFMLLPDPVAALHHVSSLLAPNGILYFTQTFEHRRSRLVEAVKPMLRLITTIDFGRVTYEADFSRALTDAGVEIDSCQVLHPGKRRSSMLIVAHFSEPLAA